MRATPQRDTRPERAIRSYLHRKGLRFRVHAPLPGTRRRADMTFPRLHVAVFVDGCFWHGCPDHMTWPENNAAWWRKKIEATRLRDRETTQYLTEAGWHVVRLWEHTPVDVAAAAVVDAVDAARRRLNHA